VAAAAARVGAAMRAEGWLDPLPHGLGQRLAPVDALTPGQAAEVTAWREQHPSRSPLPYERGSMSWARWLNARPLLRSQLSGDKAVFAGMVGSIADAKQAMWIMTTVGTGAGRGAGRGGAACRQCRGRGVHRRGEGEAEHSGSLPAGPARP
jgi:hypothetical protein